MLLTFKGIIILCTLRSKHCQLNFDKNLSCHVHCKHSNFRDIKSKKKEISEIIKYDSIIKTIPL